MQAERRMKIGELARRTGKTVRALHLYEEMGLLLPARSEGGFRLYGEAEFKRVTWIKTLQDMGFRLAQIRGLLESVSDSNSAPEAMESVRQLFQERLRETRRQVEVLLKLERDIAESMAYLEGCRSCDESNAGACATCDQDRHGIPEPALVAGIHLTKPLQMAQSQAPMGPGQANQNGHTPLPTLPTAASYADHNTHAQQAATPPGVAPVATVPAGQGYVMPSPQAVPTSPMATSGHGLPIHGGVRMGEHPGVAGQAPSGSAELGNHGHGHSAASPLPIHPGGVTRESLHSSQPAPPLQQRDYPGN